MYKAFNIHITCSKPGKLTKSHMQYWAEEVLKPSVEENFLLLLDSWSGQTDHTLFDEDIECNELQIPPKTTSQIQPWDKYFFCGWKYLYQRCFDRVAIDQLPIDLRSRDSILKLHSLLHNQLSSKRFIPMICYAWFACGYAVQDPDQFENVRDACFPIDKIFVRLLHVVIKHLFVAAGAQNSCAFVISSLKIISIFNWYTFLAVLFEIFYVYLPYYHIIENKKTSDPTEVKSILKNILTNFDKEFNRKNEYL